MTKYPVSYIQYLAHFHGDRDYFECHEILEEYWKATDAGNKKSIWVALILLAVSNYHHRRKNFSGAIRTLGKAIELFSSDMQAIRRLGIDADLLTEFLGKRRKNLFNNVPYTSFNLPIIDAELKKLCLEECKQNGFTWGKTSDMDNPDLIHRHSTRDRTEVISERRMAQEERKSR
ncbi:MULTISPECIES: DUF309 domain-containing protein [unclassified Mesobacillus]|uniref:DUF309 domain-containing protein n=1 Tax=unclassified Mesobacillus TaxID=2675270 RepID=UPI00203A5B7C|nr:MULTISPECIES: DUF309 domain-containing protein [unclassified Mesobacillus]MCM3122261.1 DUF309 domain-containing protein [Mesobacillus sp. MER 33]MCM3232225.1 DUF309 domain-containing protein [Mesobacillus sp. MER 48]